jgi:hypothetical protein
MRDANRNVENRGRLLRWPVLCACLASALLVSQEASAGTILVFGQATGDNLVTLTNDGSGTSTMTATDVPVEITTLAGLPVSPSIPAFFTFNATSTGAATTSGSDVSQTFTATFSVTSEAGGGGINYLTGTFTDTFHSILGGQSAAITASAPPNSITFSSDLPIPLGPMAAVSLSFTNLSRAMALLNNSVGASGSTTMNVSATFSAAVPEPSSVVLSSIAGLMIFGGMGLRRRVRSSAA